MPFRIVAIALVASAAFAGGALVGAHSKAAAQSDCRARGSGLFSLPDARCTPGAVNPAVTQATISTTICHPGWSKSVRPPESVTEPEKLAGMRAYGDRGPPHAYEFDHFISLELGGAPNDPRNLWPEPDPTHPSPNPKDRLENRLHRLVCDGTLTLHAAQRAIVRNWVTAYRTYIQRLRRK